MRAEQVVTAYADLAPGGSRRVDYLARVIHGAARALRAGHSSSLVASDLEDALMWDVDPQKCHHPKWVFYEGRERCRYCDTDVSHHDPMGG